VVCAPSADFLERWTSYARTQAGAKILIPPLRPDDRDREIAFINSFSERSRYFRLFTRSTFSHRTWSMD
jgi:hypothetical protein